MSQGGGVRDGTKGRLRGRGGRRSGRTSLLGITQGDGPFIPPSVEVSDKGLTKQRQRRAVFLRAGWLLTRQKGGQRS